MEGGGEVGGVVDDFDKARGPSDTFLEASLDCDLDCKVWEGIGGQGVAVASLAGTGFLWRPCVDKLRARVAESWQGWGGVLGSPKMLANHSAAGTWCLLLLGKHRTAGACGTLTRPALPLRPTAILKQVLEHADMPPRCPSAPPL